MSENQLYVWVRAFYDSTLQGSEDQFEWLQGICRRLKVTANVWDAAQEDGRWRATTMRSVPAVEILYGNRTVHSWTGDIAPRLVEEHLTRMLSELSDPPLIPVGKYRIIDSTGAHRYRRWNEQGLPGGIGCQGWSSPSRASAESEVLVLDLFKTADVAGFSCRARSTASSIDYDNSVPRSFLLETSPDGFDWEFAKRVEDSVWPSRGFGQWTWTPRPTRFLRITFDPTVARPEGKHFCQLVEISVLHQGITVSQDREPAIEELVSSRLETSGQTSGKRPVKRGIQATADASAEVWCFLPDQTLPLRRVDAGEVTWIVHSGELRFVWISGSKRKSAEITAGQVITFPSMVPHSVKNGAASPATGICIVTGPDLETWSGIDVRQ